MWSWQVRSEDLLEKMWRCGGEIQLFLVSQTDEAECRSNSHHVTQHIFNSQQWLKSSTWCCWVKLNPLTRPWLFIRSVFDSNNIKYAEHKSSVCVRKHVLFGSACIRTERLFFSSLGNNVFSLNCRLISFLCLYQLIQSRKLSKICKTAVWQYVCVQVHHQSGGNKQDGSAHLARPYHPLFKFFFSVSLLFIIYTVYIYFTWFSFISL